MKRKIFIFNVIAVLFFCLTTYSQTSENQTKIEKKEQKEIERFADEFVKDLKITNDLGQVSEKFFVGDFKTRMAKNNTLGLFFGGEELRKQISDSEQYSDKVAFINFLNLLMMLDEKNYKPLVENDEDEDSDERSLADSLPPNILELIKRDKWLRLMIEDVEDENYVDPKTIEDIHNLTANMNVVSDAVRLELKKQKTSSTKKKEKTEYYPGKKCEAEKCFGLPEGTIIFAIHKYSMCLRIIKVNNELKIADIFSVVEEN